MKKPRPKKRARVRGGASIPCPKCRAATRVLRTNRSGGSVIRERVCRRNARHRFGTVEATTT
jgi:hypothetical protein